MSKRVNGSKQKALEMSRDVSIANKQQETEVTRESRLLDFSKKEKIKVVMVTKMKRFLGAGGHSSLDVCVMMLVLRYCSRQNRQIRGS